jgi:aldehyde:ferredoxin oxidoreductase
MTASALRQTGERVMNLKKAFNIREGWTAADDWLPDRLFDDPLPEGAGVGAVVSREGLRTMIQAYYTARGWTSEGLIPAGKFMELELGDLVEHLGDLVPREAGV